MKRAVSTDWQLLQSGACWDSGDFDFVVEELEDEEYERATTKAKTYCASCPDRVLLECRRHGLLHENVPYGVWGGLSSKERRSIRRANRGKWSRAREEMT